MASIKKKTAALVSEIDAIELGVSLFEALVGIKRPAGMTANQAFHTLPSDDQDRVLRAAEVAMKTVVTAINNGAAPS